MGALLGLLAAMSITTTEFFSRRITNEVGPLVAASAASLVATGVALVVALVTDGDPIGRDMLLGCVSGLGFGLGMVTYLQGVRVSSSAVVGPISAALTTLIPFGYAAVAESAPAAVAVVGAAAAVIGLVFVTVGGSAASNVREGLPLGTASGLGYGVGTAVLIDASEASGSWSLVSQRAIALLAIAAFALARRRPLVPPRRMAGDATASGVFAGLSSVLLLAGLNANPAAASVTASLFPASSVAAGRFFFRDAVSRWQFAGLVIIIVGVGAMVLG